MKKIIFLIMMAVSMRLHAQTLFHTYQDTAYYLMNEMEAKKNQFVGKPFSVLYDSLKIKPVSWRGSVASKSYFGKSMFFDFNYEREFEKAHYIIVKFESVPSYEVLFPIFFPNPGQAAGSIESIINTYKPLIVKDVVTKDYYYNSDLEPQLKTNTPIDSDPAIINQQKMIISHTYDGDSKYIWQPFSLLWNDLTIKPKTIVAYSAPNDGTNEKAARFFYTNPDNLSVTYFYISWKDPIPKSETQKNQLGNIRGFTESSEYNTYANKIVADVVVFPTSLYPGGAVSKQPQKIKEVKKSN